MFWNIMLIIYVFTVFVNWCVMWHILNKTLDLLDEEHIKKEKRGTFKVSSMLDIMATSRIFLRMFVISFIPIINLIFAISALKGGNVRFIWAEEFQNSGLAEFKPNGEDVDELKVEMLKKLLDSRKRHDAKKMKKKNSKYCPDVLYILTLQTQIETLEKKIKEKSKL